MERRLHPNILEMFPFPGIHQVSSGDDHTQPGGPVPTPEDVNDPLEPDYFVFSFTLLLVLLVIIGNSITILVFLSTPKLCNQSGLCLINLAIADLLTGLVYLPFSLPCALNGECEVRTNRALCLSVVTVSYTCYGVSFYTLVIVMVDRYLQIDRPFQYNEIFSKTKTLTTLACTWFILLAFSSGFILSQPQIIVFDEDIYHCTIAGGNRLAWPYTYCVNIFCFFVPCIAICWCSLKIAMIAHRARSRIAGQEAAVASSVNSRRSEGNRPIRHFRRSDVRVALRIFVVVAAFIICCMPFNIELIYARHTEHMFPSKAHFATVLLVEINSALNPIIYVTMYTKFRRVFKAKAKKLCGSSNHGDSVIWTITSQHRDQYTPTRRRASAMTIANSPPNNEISAKVMTNHERIIEERIVESVDEHHD